MKGYFFNAIPTDDLDTYPTGYDRNYDAESHAHFALRFFTDGVLIKDSADECKVIVNGTTLGINAGYAVIKGRGVDVEGNETANTGSGGYAVIRWNKSVGVRDVQFLVVTTLMQTEDIIDLPVAKVTVSGNTVTVTDTRTYAAYTGNVKAVDDILDTVDEAKQAAGDANVAAAEAKGDANTAQTTAEAAQTSANAAQQTANRAQTTADNSGNMAKYYGTCATIAATAAKVVTGDLFTLAEGIKVAVRFMEANTAANPTLSVGGNEAIAIVQRKSNWEAGATVIFVYDGTYWRMIEAVSQKNFYGTSATAATVAVKTVTCVQFLDNALVVGARIAVKFTYANTASSPTLNVNGTGAKTIYIDGAAAASGAWSAGQAVDFVYDGTYWRMVNTSAAALGLEQSSGTLSPYTLNGDTWGGVAKYRRIGQYVLVDLQADVSNPNTYGTLLQIGGFPPPTSTVYTPISTLRHISSNYEAIVPNGAQFTTDGVWTPKTWPQSNGWETGIYTPANGGRIIITSLFGYYTSA